jgi:NAD(P)-dependent dehydrogenase (short-subunit alcohol dehydrogenase family)
MRKIQMPQPDRFYGRLFGKTAIVTGAGTEGDGIGIGRAIAIVLAGEGARVCLVDRNPDHAEATRQRILTAGGDAFVFAGDVTVSADCARSVAETVAHFGGLDVLVNNVGVADRSTIAEIDEAQWSRVMDINLKSALLMSKAVIPVMAKGGGGSIINISSIAGLRAHGPAAYGPSKAAMGALAREIALIHGRDGIRANIIAPGYIPTPIAGNDMPAEIRDRRRRAGPLGIEGDAWDVALAALFFASDESRFVTGALLPVDGGANEVGTLCAYGLMSDA